jgi:hypothetical protein
MPDWQELVRQHLCGLALDAAEKDEVHAELAAHLEDSYESLRTKGLLEQAAIQQTLVQVANWPDLQCKILIAKKGRDFMKKRVHQLWIPGFLTLTLSMVFLMMLQKQRFQPRIVGSGPSAILFYVPWLMLLPLFGALGSYLSSRAGGSRGPLLLASVFPVLALTTALLLMFPIGMIIERVTGNHVDFSIVATALLREGIGWILVPGAALFAGGLVAQFLLAAANFPQRCWQLRATGSSGGRREGQRESGASRWRSARGGRSRYLS